MTCTQNSMAPSLPASHHQADPPSIRAASRKNRVYILREFLVENYGGHLQEKGTIVLDVAGGKGDLSWLLLNVDGLNSVVADPRITKHNHLVKSIRFLRENPDEAKIRSIPGRPTYQPLAALIPKLDGKLNFQTPKHLRLLVDSYLVQAVKAVLQSGDEAAWESYWRFAITRASLARPLGYEETGPVSEGSILDAREALRVIKSIKLVVGFHPDQATDACIDLAHVLDVPFCVCPCCVFPAEFTHRRTIDGKPVKHYDDLLRYLERKDSRIQRATLKFPETTTARNIVLYTLPASSNDSL